MNRNVKKTKISCQFYMGIHEIMVPISIIYIYKDQSIQFVYNGLSGSKMIGQFNST